MIKIRDAINRLDSWVNMNGWSGWDPYDVKDKISTSRWGSQLDKRINKIFQKILFELEDLFPLSARKIFKVKPKINAKAMGLFLASYGNIYQATGQKKYLLKAHKCADWLFQNRVQQYRGCCWGYPFDWQSINYFPKNTPSSVVSATCGDAFFILYKITDDPKLLEICIKICVFFIESLKITHEDQHALCYSYTPKDDYQVHNANLFVGEYLVRIGKEINDDFLIDRGIKCGYFALKEQQTEGYLPYWGLAQTNSHGSGKLRTDHYHSGFEIRMLYKLWKHTGLEAFHSGYVKYFDWYLRNMFISECIPKMTPNALYPVNIHSCAEALLCQATLLPDHPDRLSTVMRSANWVLSKMEYAPGQYTYLIKRYPVLGELRIDFPMIRWGQAWMLRAYSELLKFMKTSSVTESLRNE